MKHLKNKMVIKAVVLVLMISVLSVNAFSWWSGNHGEIVYPDPTGKSTVSPITNYIAIGAGYFLKAYSNTLQLMNKIELSGINGINTDEWNALSDKTLYNMTMAKETYMKLVKETESLPYNTSVLGTLKQFDYNAFQSEISADKEIFAEVKAYLVKGDMNGVFGKILGNTEKIEAVLIQVKGKVYAGIPAMINDIYQVNQLFSNSLLFGQYAAQVCGRIKGVN